MKKRSQQTLYLIKATIFQVYLQKKCTLTSLLNHSYL